MNVIPKRKTRQQQIKSSQKNLKKQLKKCQESAMKAVASTMLPTLPGGFTIQLAPSNAGASTNRLLF